MNRPTIDKQALLEHITVQILSDSGILTKRVLRMLYEDIASGKFDMPGKES